MPQRPTPLPIVDALAQRGATLSKSLVGAHTPLHAPPLRGAAGLYALNHRFISANQRSTARWAWRCAHTAAPQKKTHKKFRRATNAKNVESKRLTGHAAMLDLYAYLRSGLARGFCVDASECCSARNRAPSDLTRKQAVYEGGGNTIRFEKGFDIYMSAWRSSRGFVFSKAFGSFVRWSLRVFKFDHRVGDHAESRAKPQIQR
jgi:hypothetical protein